MVTSLGDLLDTLVDTARNELAESDNPAVRADAGTALGHVSRALAQLRADGVSRVVGDKREHQVLELSRTCREIAASAPVAEARLTMLAAAAADTVAVLRADTTTESRWAAATAFVDAVGPLCDLIEPGAAVGPMADRLAAARGHILGAEQTAALQPPSRADAAVLDRPIPSTIADSRVGAATSIRESVARLAFATRTNTGTLSVAEVLAVTFAAQSLSEAAQSPRPESDKGRYARVDVSAADAWRAVRTALAPFTDGSRYVHSDMPPVVLAARNLHGALERIDPTLGRAGLIHESIVEATQHLPAIADDLHRRAVRWAETGGLLAYACDLPPREHNLAQGLAGHRSEGVIRTDAVDLQHVTDAICSARMLGTDLAGHAGRPDATTFPRRAWAAHQALLERPNTPAAISEAKQEAYRQLHAVRHQPPPRRTR